MNRTVSTALLLLLCGCYGEFDPPQLSGSSTTGSTGTTSMPDGPSTSSSSAATTDTPGSSTTVATSSTSSTSGASTGSFGCTGVDVLFVVDRSDSMNQYADALTALALQGNAIVNELKGFGEFHIGVTLNSIPRSNEMAVTLPESPNPDNPYDCQETGALIRPNTQSCDEILNGLAYATNEVSSIVLALQCLVTAMGNDGKDSESSEPVQAISQSISPTNGEISACNDGFRDPDHALLVVVVTDSDNPISATMLTQVGFRNSVGRGPGRLGMAVLAGDCGGVDAKCGAEPACNLEAFVDGALRDDDPEAIKIDICDALVDADRTIDSTIAQLVELLPQICE